jgi:hypothetical protein
MWQELSARIQTWRSKYFHRKVKRLLKLRGPGSANNGLLLRSLRTNMQVEWRAREIHSWDRQLPSEERVGIFVLQVLSDTASAISKLFHSNPFVDSLEIRVFDTKSEIIIMNGVVGRTSLATPRPQSDRMWLGQLGMRFRLVGNRFEPLSCADLQGAA